MWSLFSEFDTVRLVILISLSLLLPLSIFFGRGSIRKRRLHALKSLQDRIVECAPEKGPLLSPYFELVRARYEHGGFRGPKHTDGVNKERRSAVSEVAAYLPPTIIFIIISGMGLYLVLLSMNFTFEPDNLFLRALFEPERNATDMNPGMASAGYMRATALIISAGFLGSYIWSINYLILRVANFDLTPLDFLRVAAHVLLTVLVVGVLRHFAGATTGEGLATAVVLGIAFMMGLFPALGVATLVDRLPSHLRLKRIVPQASEISRELPLDLIDGIDAGIKFRLGSYEITDVQNLATVNPIALYVSTPYSLMQILDWIAQAQLLSALGPQGFLLARKQTIRDIQGLVDMGSTVGGRQLLGPIFFEATPADDVIVAKLASITRPPHVQLILALWNLTTPHQDALKSGGEERLRVVQAA